LFAFSCFILALSLVGLMEFYRMALPGRRTGGVLASVVGTAFFISLVSNLLPAYLALTVPVLIFGLLSLLRIDDIKGAAGETALFLMGALYVPLLLSHLVLLREMPLGVRWVFLLLVIVMAGDTAAFYVGSSLGKRKLYPLVSPNKSVEGMLGGLAGSVAGTFLAKATFFPQLTPVDCVATALLVGLLGQLGDLFESLLKRSCGVKDSGNIFPGHGGMLDRLDSVLFAAPTLYIYVKYFFR
jgi:phosphatidate cytidylyltransferase